MSRILNEKNYKSYNYTSRYANVPYYFNNLDSKYVYGTGYQLSKDNTYVSHKVVKGDSFDSLSLTYYNSPLYFWVIMDFNDMQDPFQELEEGTILKIPTITNIAFEVNK